MLRNPRHDEQGTPYAIDDGGKSGKDIEQRINIFPDAAMGVFREIDGHEQGDGEGDEDGECRTPEGAGEER